MRPERARSILSRLANLVPNGCEIPPRATRFDTKRYSCPNELERERRLIFGKAPVPIAFVSQLSTKGAVQAVPVGHQYGQSLLVINTGATGCASRDIRVFTNACRHRGAELLPCGAAEQLRVLTCPYHGWTYGLDGSLKHIPHGDSFGPMDKGCLSLREVRAEVRHGAVWAWTTQLLPNDSKENTTSSATSTSATDSVVASFLGPVVDEDWAAFNLEDHTVARVRDHTVPANWKLVMDAFSEGYHIRMLHKTTIKPFFHDAFAFDDLSPHIFFAGGRKTLTGTDEDDLRRDTTPVYNIFPNSVLVFHPNWVSWMTLWPINPSSVFVRHAMLTHPSNAPTQDKLDQSFDLIDGQVFQKEDFIIASSIQRTLSTEPVSSLNLPTASMSSAMVLGAREEGMRLFHVARDEWLRADKQ